MVGLNKLLDSAEIDGKTPVGKFKSEGKFFTPPSLPFIHTKTALTVTLLGGGKEEAAFMFDGQLPFPQCNFFNTLKQIVSEQTKRAASEEAGDVEVSVILAGGDR